VLSRERATLDRHAGLLRDQRRDVDRAVGVTLDLLGFDLGVPRFPALPYGFEDRTIALYHLDDADGAPVADAAALYTGAAGHPGTAVGARARAPGRFGRGFAFDTAGARIEIAHADDLATGAQQDLTVECFVRPDVATGEGAVVSKHADPADPALAGWALSVGEFGRGVPRNVQFLVAAGGPVTLLHADTTLPTARFSHVAGVVDRTAGAARLLVDGRVVASAPFVGVLTNQAPVLIGRAGADAAHAFSGGMDEVRLSAAARTCFAPVLGESDEGYRRRLEIFRRWTLPTPAGMTDALADAVPELHGVSRPLLVTDVDSTLVQAARTLLVEPGEIPVGATVDDVGARGVDQASAAGRPEDDVAFDRALLVDATDLGARFAPRGPSGADARLMRVGTRAALRALLDLVVAAGGRAYDLAVTGGYDPAATDLRAVGRALHLTHATVPTGALAGLALRAGFAHVAHRGDPDDVVAVVRDTASVEIVLDGGAALPSSGFIGLVGGTATLRVDPTPPPGATVRWSTINCGDGRAGIAGRRDRLVVTLGLDRPGRLVLEVAVGHNGRTVTGTRALRIGVAELAAGASITAAGAPGGAEPAGVAPDEVMHPAYLVDVDPVFSRPPGARPETRRVHPALAERLALLATMLPTGRPSLVEAWNPAAPGPGGRTPAHVGRSVTLGQGTSTATPARLAALAHAAGISWVGTDGTTIRLVQEPEALAPIHGPATVGEGRSADLRVVRAGPRAVAVTPDRVWTLNAESATVSALDGTGAVRACVKVGVTPVAIAAAPDGSLVLTADAGEVSLSLVRTSNGTVTRLPVPTPPVDVAHHPTAARAYAALTASTGDIVELDPGGAAVLRTVRTGAQVVAVRCAPAGDRLWAVTTKPELCRVDLGTFAVTARVALDAPPADLAVGAQRAYVTAPSAGALVVIDLATRRIVARFADAGAAPTRLALSPAGNLLYVVDPVEGRVRLRAADGSSREAPGRQASRAVAGVTAAAASADRAYLATGGTAADAVTVLAPADGAALVAAWPLGTGLGEQLVWSVRASGGAAATLAGATRALTTLTGVRAGPVQVRAVYRWPNAPGPYKVRIEPSEELLAREAAGHPTVIQRDQFDLVMNVLNHLCPVGVEVDTSAVRDRVVELRTGLLEAFPPHTYPDFRARGPRPPAFRFGSDDKRRPTTGEFQ
jgi:DNA-binding beta-propeller fold protein YncE